MSSSGGSAVTVRVLLSIPPPRPTTNPYAVMLADSLKATPGLDVRHFCWAEALRGRYDVFHVHWPDALPVGADAPRTLARHVLLGALVARLRLRGTPVVRTLHNPQPHEEHHRVTEALMAALNKLTSATISLNPVTTPMPSVPNFVIPLGDLGPWYSRLPRRSARPFHLVSFGVIRPYKNLESLVTAVLESEDPRLHLTIVGPAPDRELVARLTALAGDDPRIEIRPYFVDDALLVELVTSSALVVLPYQDLHNSAALFTALGLGRPALVPENEVTRAVADEVGPLWVRRYQGALTSATLAAALWDLPGCGSPDLSARGWQQVGAEHLAVYRSVLSTSHKPRSADHDPN